MPRARDPARDKSRQMWEESGRTLKLCDIAARLDVPEASVRAWKSKDGWDKKNERGAPNDKRSAPQKAPNKKVGAPLGNKNAVGKVGGAPLRNKHAYAHGIFANVYLDTLDEDELAMVENLPDDIVETLRLSIKMLTAKERRLMKTIQRLENEGANTGSRTVESVHTQEAKRVFDSDAEKEEYDTCIEARIADGRRLPGRELIVSTTQSDNRDRLFRAHSELRMTSAEKRQTLAQLFAMGITIEKLELERSRIENDNERLALEKAKLELYRQRALGIIDLDELVAPAILELEEPGVEE